MSGYLLDLTALVEVLRAAPAPRFMRRLSSVATVDRWTSAVVVGELMHAARRAADPGVMSDVLRLVSAVRVAPFDLATARTYAKLAATLEWAGVALPAADLMTAATARTLEMTLVTRRPHVFTRVPQLAIEDWTVGLSSLHPCRKSRAATRASPGPGHESIVVVRGRRLRVSTPPR